MTTTNDTDNQLPGQVRDNAALSRLELDLNGKIGFAIYRREGGVLAILHTEVPRELREHGHGTRLARAVLDHARAQGLKVRPLCGFVRHFIATHPDYADLVA